MRKDCSFKKRYGDLSTAMRAADSVMDRLALAQAPICAYWCERHQCHHIGHQRWIKGERAKAYASRSWERARLARETAFCDLMLALIDHLLDAYLATERAGRRP